MTYGVISLLCLNTKITPSTLPDPFWLQSCNIFLRIKHFHLCSAAVYDEDDIINGDRTLSNVGSDNNFPINGEVITGRR